MNTFKLNVASPDGNIYVGDVTRIILRGSEGDLAVMAGHVPFATPTKTGECVITGADGSETRLELMSGLLVVGREGTTLLSGGKNA